MSQPRACAVNPALMFANFATFFHVRLGYFWLHRVLLPKLYVKSYFWTTEIIPDQPVTHWSCINLYLTDRNKFHPMFRITCPNLIANEIVFVFLPYLPTSMKPGRDRQMTTPAPVGARISYQLSQPSGGVDSKF